MFAAAMVQMVPFSAFSTSRWEYGSPRLERYNGLQSLEILGPGRAERSTGEAMALMEELAGKLPSGIGYDWTGMSYQERLSGNQATPVCHLAGHRLPVSGGAV